MHEIQKKIWPKAFFWSIMKMAIRNVFRNMSQGLPNPGFMQEKVQKGDFLWSPMMKKKFQPIFQILHIKSEWFLLELAMALVTAIGIRFLQVCNKESRDNGYFFWINTFIDKNINLMDLFCNQSFISFHIMGGSQI